MRKLTKRKTAKVRCLKCMRYGPVWRFRKLVTESTGVTYGYRCRIRCMK